MAAHTSPLPKRSVAQAYRAGELPEFFRLRPQDLPVALAEERQVGQVDREALCAALRAYHQDLGTLDRHVEAQLGRLAHPRSRVVVTGQQAGLLTGPAYSVHKGAGCALLAQEVSQEDAPVVAIYWVASQDHDAAEVASATLLDMHEELHRLTLNLPRGVPVGRLAWQDAWTQEVNALLERFAAPEAYKTQVSALLKRAIAGGSFADVFARLLHGLLGARGLVALDPLHPALARLFVPALQRELHAPLEGPRRIEQAAAALEARGFEPQLRRPQGATNLFLEGEDGQRRLLRFDGRRFHAERAYQLGELQGLLERDPSRLTPAAGLRPVLQDSVLPTVAFVVGPGEIAYGAQLRGVYEWHGLAQPLLWPRLSVTWLEPPAERLLARFGLSARAFQADPDAALGEALLRASSAHEAVNAQLGALEAAFRTLGRDIAALDPTLVGAVQRTEARSLARVERLRGQAARALVRAEDERTGQARRLKLHLLPRGAPQEREMCFLTYLLKHGPAPLDRLFALPPGWSGELPL